MAVIVNGDGILTGISSLATALTDITSGRGTVTGVATVGTLQLGAGVSISSPRSQQAAILTNNTEFFTVDDAGRVGVGTITPNSDAHPENEKKINVGFITARSIAGDIDANTMVVAGIATFTNASTFKNNVTVTSGNLTMSGAGNIVLGDSASGTDDRLTFGASTDLEIFHNGSNNHIDCHTAGQELYIRPTKDVYFQDYVSDDVLVKMTKDGPVQLYYDNTTRVATTPSGADVTGTLNVTGITTVKSEVNATGVGDPIVEIRNSRLNTGSGAAGLRFITNEISGSNQYTRAQISAEYDGASNVSGRLIFSTTNSSGTLTERLRVDDDGRMSLGTDNPGQFNAGADDFVIQGSGSCGITIDATSSSNSNIYFADGPTGNEAYRGYTQYQHSNDVFVLGRAGVDHLYLQNDGGTKNVLGNFIVGTAGRGLQFNAADSGSSEILDDYEEGTFTPTVTTSGGSIAVNGSYNVLSYTKIGRLVHVTGQIVLTPTNPSGNLDINGLPFTPVDLSDLAGRSFCTGLGYFNGSNVPSGSAVYTINMRVLESSTTFRVEGIVPNYDGSIADWVGNGTDIWVNLTYFAA